jgi:hypothetical protein
MNDVIELVQGTYGISGNGNSRFYYGSSEPYSIVIKGGYSSGCSSREMNPANTILDGEGIEQGDAGVLYLYDWGSSPYTKLIVEGVTVENGKSYNGGGLSAYTNNGDITLTSNLIRDNIANYYAGVYTASGYGGIILTNNIITGNTASNYGGGVYAYSYQGKTDIVNNTIMDNSVPFYGGLAGGIYLRLDSNTAESNIYNNIIWGNTASYGGDIFVDNWAGGTVKVYNNDFDPAKVSGIFTSEGNNINIDPVFVDAANGDYHLTAGSPCIDEGNNAAPSLPSTDFEGDGRVLGIAPDIGADEHRAPDVFISPTSCDFGNINVGSSSAQTFIISNTGTADLLIGIISITSTNASEFIIQNDNCSGQTIAPPPGTCTVYIIFSPTSTGAKSAILSITSNDPDENPLNVNLNGAGVDTTPPSGSIMINSGDTYTNSISVTLTLSASDPSGVSQLCVSNTTSCSLWETYTTPKAWTLLSGDGTKTVYVWFKDGAGNANTTPYSDSIIFDATAPSNGTLSATPGNAQVSLSWTGFLDSTSGIGSYKLVYSTSGTPGSCSSGIQIYSGSGNSYTHSSLTNGTTYYYRVCAIDNAGNVSTGATSSAKPEAPISNITANPASLYFASVNVGKSSIKTVAVSNTGTTNLEIGTIEITGTNASEFSILNDTCSGQTIAPSGTCRVDVRFSPASGIPARFSMVEYFKQAMSLLTPTGYKQTKSAILSIPSNDPDTPTLEVLLSGKGYATMMQRILDIQKVWQRSLFPSAGK